MLFRSSYTNLIGQDLLFVHTDGTAKRVKGNQFAVKTKRTKIQANKEGITALYIGLIPSETLIGQYADGYEKRIDVNKIPFQGKTGGGVRVFWSEKYKFEGIKDGTDSNLPIVSFATQPKKEATE